MGILDEVLGGVEGGGASPIGGVLADLVGGGGLQGGVASGAGAAGGGGLGSLLSRFDQAGLGHIAQSWVGTGRNQPVSPDQLRSVLGDGKVQSMASQAGMQPQDLLLQLSRHLPNLVQHRWRVGCLYNQETAEKPQLYWSHMWKEGATEQLAQEVRQGLDLCKGKYVSKS